MNAVTRGRPKSETKREQIFEAAADLFPQHGFENVSMDMLAEAAGVSKQTLYSHFSNKEALYSATISRKCIANQLSAEFMDYDKPCAEMLLNIGRRFVGLLLSEDAICMYRRSVGSAEQHPDLARLFYQGGPQHTISTVADYLRHQHDKGLLDIPDARRAACQFLYMLKADAITRAVLNVEEQPSEEEVDNYIKSCVAVFLRAYGPA